MEGKVDDRFQSHGSKSRPGKSRFLTTLLLLSLMINQAQSFRNVSSRFLPVPGPDEQPVPPGLPGFGSSWDDFRSLVDARRGQEKPCDKLPMLKRYLQQFGYTTWNEFTTDFDNKTETAIKLYQSNFHLNATGVLDEATITQMMRPRCGGEDVVGGISAMARGRSNSSSTRFVRGGARGGVRGGGLGVRHYSFFPNSPSWVSRQDLTYAISPSSSALTGIPAADLSALFAEAFGRWAAVVPMNFTEITRFAAADIRIMFAHGEHGDGRAFDGVLGVLAHGFSPEDGNLHFDAAETWTLDVTGSSSRTTVDLMSVAVHEIGHIIGLGHSAVESAVMYPNIGAREVKTQLHSDDVEGAQVLYGANPNYDPSTTRTGATGSQPENGIPSSSAGAAVGGVRSAIVAVVGGLLLLLLGFF